MHQDPPSAPLTFRKSSYSGTSSNCVEVAQTPIDFRKSSYSATRNECVEVADTPAASAMRDTQHRDKATLQFQSTEWRAFLTAAKNHQL